MINTYTIPGTDKEVVQMSKEMFDEREKQLIEITIKTTLQELMDQGRLPDPNDILHTVPNIMRMEPCLWPYKEQKLRDAIKNGYLGTTTDNGKQLVSNNQIKEYFKCEGAGINKLTISKSA